MLQRGSRQRRVPESQLAKPDVHNQLAREIVTKQVNAGGIRRTDPGGIFHLFPYTLQWFAARSTQGCCQGILADPGPVVAQPCPEDVLAALSSSGSMCGVWLSQARICSLSWPSAGGGSLWRGGVRQNEIG